MSTLLSSSIFANTPQNAYQKYYLFNSDSDKVSTSITPILSIVVLDLIFFMTYVQEKISGLSAVVSALLAVLNAEDNVKGPL